MDGVGSRGVGDWGTEVMGGSGASVVFWGRDDGSGGGGGVGKGM